MILTALDRSLNVLDAGNSLLGVMGWSHSFLRTPSFRHGWSHYVRTRYQRGVRDV